MLPLTPDQCQILVASKDPKAIANRLRDDQQLCREQLLPSVLVYFLPLSDTILANEIVHHLLPALDVHVPLVVRKLQYEGIINGIEGYLAQMNQISKNANSIYEANVNEDAPFDERGDSAKKFERVDDAFNPRQSHLAGPQLKIALKVLEDLKGRELVNDTTTLASIMRVLQTLIVKAEESTTPLPPQGLEVPQQKCYICRYIIESPHKLYTSLCIPCGDFNLAKGSLSLPKTLDLRGRTAFVTGGRINLGFHTTLRLLRCGAHVIVSSRYPRDAEFRYHDEEDSETWMQRLKIIGADFRTAKDVFRLVSSIQDVLSEWKEERESLGQLFLLINNAAQTLTDPIAAEKKAIANEEHFRRERICNRVVDNGYHPTIRGGSLMPGGLLETSQSGSIVSSSYSSQKTELVDCHPKTLSHEGYDRQDSSELNSSNHSTLSKPLPTDFHHPQKSSWAQTLSDIPYEDMITAHSVNAFVPTILIRELLPLMPSITHTLSSHPTPLSPVSVPPPQPPNPPTSNPTPPLPHHLPHPLPISHIINVSAREGTPESHHHSAEKRGRHVHTNMAKAALNMITETEAGGLWRSRRCAMNTVDPGFMSAAPEVRFGKARGDREREAPGEGEGGGEGKGVWKAPLGFEDGAARVLWCVAVAEAGVEVRGKEKGEGRRERKAIWGRYLKHFGRERVDVSRGR